MFELVYGVAGSGKSGYIEKVVDEKVIAGEKVMIIVPDQHSFVTERRVLEKFGDELGGKIKVMWFNRLAADISERYGNVKQNIISNSGKALLMSKAIGDCRDNIEFYKRQHDKPDFIADMLKFSKDLKFCKISTDELCAAADDGENEILNRKIKELSAISDKYDELVEKSFLNPDDILIKINEILKTHNYFEGYTVAVDGFGFFDLQQLDIISKIISTAKDTYITLCTDGTAYDAGDYSRFSDVKKTAYRLVRAANEAGVEIRYKHLSKLSVNAELSALNSGLYEIGHKEYEGEPDCIEIYECDNIADECDAAAVRIKRLLIENNYRYKDVAVFVRDENAYIPFLKRSLAKHSIPFFKDARRSVSNEPLMLFCHFALKTVADNFRLDDVTACIKSPVAGFDTEKISGFENYCIVWNINGVRKWTREFTYNPRGFTDRFDAEDKKNLDAFNETRKQIITPLHTFSAACRNGTVKDISAALYRLLEDVNAAENIKKLMERLKGKNESDIAERQGEVWQLLMSVLDQIVLTRGEEKISVRQYLKLFDLAVLSENIGIVPQNVDEILIGNADRIRTDMPKAALLLGVNDGEFPQAFSSSSIFTESDRASLSLKGVSVGLSPEEMSSQEKFYAYCAACAPSEILYVSYKRADFDGAQLSASTLVSEIMSIFPALKIKKSDVLNSQNILSKEQGFEALTKLWNTDSALKESLKEIYLDDESYAGKVRMLESSGREEHKIKTPGLGVELFGKDLYISPTQFESYFKCPFMYFCKYGLKALPAQKAQLDARTGGSLIHFVLENFFHEHKNKQQFLDMSKEEIEQLTVKYAEEYISELRLPEEFITERFKYIVDKDRKISENTILNIQQEMHGSEYYPEDFELRISKFNPELKGYEIQLKDGKASFTGAIDRVDLMQKGDKKYARVIDYKTGSKKFKLGEAVNGINAQMLIYLLNLAECKQGKYAGIIPAGILYLESNNEPVSANVKMSEEDLQKAKDGAKKMNGLLLDDAVSLTGMEADGKGTFIPAKLKKGVYTGNLVSTEDMGLIKRRIDRITAQMGNNLHEGKIDNVRFDDDRLCTYCDYYAVCRNKDKVKNVKVSSGIDDALKELREEDDGYER